MSGRKKARKIFYAPLRGEKILKGEAARVSRGIFYTLFCRTSVSPVLALSRGFDLAARRAGAVEWWHCHPQRPATIPACFRQTHAPRAIRARTTRRNGLRRGGVFVCGCACSSLEEHEESLSAFFAPTAQADKRLFICIPAPPFLPRFKRSTSKDERTDIFILKDTPFYGCLYITKGGLHFGTTDKTRA